ncbi:unnamed protein product [Tilletia caries]|nr:unnamed protein product [Tilletia caries]CAD6960587.1 unnamed protein product [Tilletia caries]
MQTSEMSPPPASGSGSAGTSASALPAQPPFTAEASSSSSSSTTPIVRAALACLPCRQVKAKCSGTPPAQLLQDDGKMLIVPLLSVDSPSASASGVDTSPNMASTTAGAGAGEVPAEVPCDRCARLRKNCVWAPSHRTGRPRKKKARVEGTTVQTAQSAHTPPTTSSSAYVSSSFQPFGSTSASQDAGMGDGLPVGNGMFGSDFSMSSPWSAFLQSFSDQPGAPFTSSATSALPAAPGTQYSNLTMPPQTNSNMPQSSSLFYLDSLLTDPLPTSLTNTSAPTFGSYGDVGPTMRGQSMGAFSDASTFPGSGSSPTSSDMLLMDEILASLGMPSTAAPSQVQPIPIPTDVIPQPPPKLPRTESPAGVGSSHPPQRATVLTPFEQMLALRQRIVGGAPSSHSSPTPSLGPSSSRPNQTQSTTISDMGGDPLSPIDLAASQMPAVIWQGLRHYFGHGAGACAILGSASDFVQSVGRAFVVLGRQQDERYGGEPQTAAVEARLTSAYATVFAAHAACAVGFRLAGKTDAARFGSAGTHTLEEAQRLGKRVEKELVGVLGRIGDHAEGGGETSVPSGAAFLLRGRTSSSRNSSSTDVKGKRPRDASDDEMDTELGEVEGVSRRSSTPPNAVVDAESDGSFLLLRALQGFLIMTLLHYGLGSPETAARYLQRGIDVAVKSGLHRLDSPQPVDGGDKELEGWRIGTRLRETRKEELRRVWWELYHTDLMLNLSTSNMIPRALASMPNGTAMHMPLDLVVDPTSSSKSGARETMDVRIRASALLHEATLPTARQLSQTRQAHGSEFEPGSKSSRPTPAEYARAETLDLIAANLLVRAHNARANVSQRFEALLRREVVAEERRRVAGRMVKEGDGGRDGARGAKDECLFMDVRPERDALRAASAEKEMLFMAMLMLRAARIHIHRMLHFSDLNINFETCSLRPVQSRAESAPARIVTGAREEGQSSGRPDAGVAEMTRDLQKYTSLNERAVAERGDDDVDDHYVTQKIGASVKIITTSANEIVHLVRSDYESVRRINATTMPYSNNSSTTNINVSRDIYPLHASGSSACTGEVISHTCPSTVSPILRHGTFFGCSMVVAAYAYCIAIAGSAQAPDTPFASSRPGAQFDSEGRRVDVEVADPERDRQLWTKRLLLSNLGFAESVLEEGADVWPVQAKMKEEVNAARRMIDSFWYKMAMANCVAISGTPAPRIRMVANSPFDRTGPNPQHDGQQLVIGTHSLSMRKNLAVKETFGSSVGCNNLISGSGPTTSNLVSDSGSNIIERSQTVAGLSEGEIARYAQQYTADFNCPVLSAMGYEQVHSSSKQSHGSGSEDLLQGGAAKLALGNKDGFSVQTPFFTMPNTAATATAVLTVSTNPVATSSANLSSQTTRRPSSSEATRSGSASRSPTPSCVATPSLRKWKVPERYSTLDDFAPMIKFNSGKQNLRVLKYGLPSEAFKPIQLLGTTSSGNGTSVLERRREDGEHTQLESRSFRSVIEVLYPQGSSNPGGKIVGGAQFYALTALGAANTTSCSKATLSSAKKVTFRYSVWFPPNFQFVKGGKLPGLYGGRENCSGGDSAADCWSSRMMWREKGAGELYLYVPQKLQDPGLCKVPPFSVCNDAYGISVGRGSFKFHTGAWTHIQQTLTMGSHNASLPDGALDIVVDGVRRFSFDKVFYPAQTRGIFFSTFFGGNGDEWATPVDQKVWFRDFSLSIDA